MAIRIKIKFQSFKVEVSDMCETCIKICNAIGYLTDEEASAVNILAENASFEGVNRAVECCGDWTNYVDVRFEGDNLLQCLERAVTAKREEVFILK